MLIEINYQQPYPNEDGFIVAKRLIRDDDIVTVDPKIDDSTKSVLRIKGSGSQFVQAFTDLTLHETYDSFKTRYGNSSSTSKVVAYQADAQQANETQEAH